MIDAGLSPLLALGGTAAAIAAIALTEAAIVRRGRDRVPIRITVHDSIDSNSLVQLITDGARGGGQPSIGLMTGSRHTLILPSGRRMDLGPGNGVATSEIAQALRWGARAGCKLVVIACPSEPEPASPLPRLVRPTHCVLASPEIAQDPQQLSPWLSAGTRVLHVQGHGSPTLEAVAGRAKAVLQPCAAGDEPLWRGAHRERGESVSLASDLLEALGVDRALARQAMRESPPHPDAATWVQLSYFGRQIDLVHAPAVHQAPAVAELWETARAAHPETLDQRFVAVVAGVERVDDGYLDLIRAVARCEGLHDLVLVGAQGPVVRDQLRPFVRSGLGLHAPGPTDRRELLEHLLELSGTRASWLLLGGRCPATESVARFVINRGAPLWASPAEEGQ